MTETTWITQQRQIEELIARAEATEKDRDKWKARSDEAQGWSLQHLARAEAAEKQRDDLTGRLKTAIGEAKMLEARAEAAEASVKELRAYNERLSGLVDKWHRDAEFNGTACDEQKKRAEAAEKRYDELFARTIDTAVHNKLMDVADARAEAAEKLCNEALRERDEVWEDKEFQQARADRAEKERDRLRLVLERISNAKPHLKDLIRAALEAKL